MALQRLYRNELGLFFSLPLSSSECASCVSLDVQGSQDGRLAHVGGGGSGGDWFWSVVGLRSRGLISDGCGWGIGLGDWLGKPWSSSLKYICSLETTTTLDTLKVSVDEVIKVMTATSRISRFITNAKKSKGVSISLLNDSHGSSIWAKELSQGEQIFDEISQSLVQSVGVRGFAVFDHHSDA
ncbi:hypothetical protein Tco_0480976 [Tanacetum coccineum]